MPEIDLGKYYLRDVCEADYLDLFEVLRHDEVTKYLTYNSLKKPNEALYMIREFYLKRPTMGMPIGYAIVSKKTEELIGTIEFHTYLSGINACEIGFLLHPNYWHKGIMHKALGEMINLGFNYLDLDKIIVGCVDINFASKKLILDMGFNYEREEYASFECKNGELRSILYFSMYKYERMM